MMVLLTAVNKTTNSWKRSVCCTLHSWSFPVPVIHEQHSSATQMHSGSWTVWKCGIPSCQKCFSESEKWDSNLFHMLFLKTMASPVRLTVFDSCFSSGWWIKSGSECDSLGHFITSVQEKTTMCNAVLNNLHFTKCKNNVFPLFRILCLFKVFYINLVESAAVFFRLAAL